MRGWVAAVLLAGLVAAGPGAEAGWELWRYARDPEQPSLSWELIATVESAEACQAELEIHLEYEAFTSVYLCLPDTIDPRWHDAGAGPSLG